MENHFYAIIMAGGGGTRLWPLSRQNQPKQMLSLFEKRTLFQAAVQRLDGMFSPDRIFVVTVQSQAHELQAECPDIPVENYLLEPMPRGTASVVCLAATVLHLRDPQAVMAVLTADHFIGHEERFHQLLRAAHDIALEGYLVTLGVEPTSPSAGFGYIQRGNWLGSYQGLDAYQVVKFKEKPAIEQAREMLANGDHAWNSGMFVWQVEKILEEFARQMPELYAQLQEISNNWDTSARNAILQQVWPLLKSQTIDYGIMEGARNVAVVPAAGLDWSDVGSWDSLFDLIPGDLNHNIVVGGEHLGLETHGTLIHINQENRLIVTIGLDNLVIVDTPDVLLVCQKDQAQRVREIVNQLKGKRNDLI